MVALSARLQPIFEFARPMQLYGFTPLAIIASALVVVALTAPAESHVRSVLEWRGLRMMGKYSYALYLFHVPILIALIQHGWTPGILPRIGGSTMPGFFVFAGGCLTVSLVAASLSWHVFESRMLALKRYFPYDRSAQQKNVSLAASAALTAADRSSDARAPA